MNGDIYIYICLTELILSNINVQKDFMLAYITNEVFIYMYMVPQIEHFLFLLKLRAIVFLT